MSGQKNVTVTLTQREAERMREEAKAVRCWLAGFRAGSNSTMTIVGEDVLRRIMMLMDTAK